MNILMGFLLTFLIELAIFWIFIRKNHGETLFYVLLINAFTWPLANLIYGFWQDFILIELGVFIAEGFLIALLFELDYKKAFLLSFVANFISALAGIQIFL